MALTSTYCSLILHLPSKGACTRLLENMRLLTIGLERYFTLPVGEYKRVTPEEEHKNQDQDVLSGKRGLREKCYLVYSSFTYIIGISFHYLCRNFV